MNKALLRAALALAAAAAFPLARASIAFGTINNFDTVNDTGTECHGFEIEIEGVHSKDITYTYDYNHYGVPSISEDNTDPALPRVRIRYEAKLNADGTWSAYTAVPAEPIPPTNGHQFTNPSVNFGGEHFGVGYLGAPGAIHYHWLVADASKKLVLGPSVDVTTPTFTYYAAAPGVPEHVEVEIEAPEHPEAHLGRFGPAVWVKEIKTSTHNAREVRLVDLVSDDAAFPDDKSWRNGEPAEVETEWRLLQADHQAVAGGKNGRLKAAPEDRRHGEVITRRYEFYKYVGPLDPEAGEALVEAVGADGIHGSGTAKSHGQIVDYSNFVVVGNYLGAQMSAFDGDASVGLIDQLQDGEAGVAYPERTVVVIANAPFVATLDGALPAGMAFDDVTGVLSGTPTEAGTFTVTVTADDGTAPARTKTYTFTIAPAGEVVPPHAVVDTQARPAGAGTTVGDGSFGIGAEVAVEAVPARGQAFTGWTDNGKVVSQSARLVFPAAVNRSLVANFAPVPVITMRTAAAGRVSLAWQTNFPAHKLERAGSVDAAAWAPVAGQPRVEGGEFRLDVPMDGDVLLLRLRK